jgi:hypothetical protein
MPPTVAFRDSLNLGQVVAAASRVLVQPGGVPAEGGVPATEAPARGRLSPDVGVMKAMLMALCAEDFSPPVAIKKPGFRGRSDAF